MAAPLPAQQRAGHADTQEQPEAAAGAAASALAALLEPLTFQLAARPAQPAPGALQPAAQPAAQVAGGSCVQVASAPASALAAAQQLGCLDASAAQAAAVTGPSDRPNQQPSLQASLQAAQRLMAALAPSIQACSSLLASAAAAAVLPPSTDAASQTPQPPAGTAAGTQTAGEGWAEVAAGSRGVQTEPEWRADVADAQVQTDRLPPEVAELVVQECALCGRQPLPDAHDGGAEREDGGLRREIPLLKCVCKVVYYCNRSCQARDWPTHKRYCGIVRRALGLQPGFGPRQGL